MKNFHISKYSGVVFPLAVVLLLSLGTPELFAAKTNPEKETAYQTILKSFEAKNWDETLLLIERYQAKYSNSDRDAGLIMLAAESNLKLRRLSKADALAHKIIVQFPEVGLLDRARLVLGESALLAGDWDNAEFHLAWVVSFGSNPELSQIARKRLDELHGYLAAQEKEVVPVDTFSQPRVALILPSTGSMMLEADYFLTGFLSAWKNSTLPDPFIFDSENDPVKAVRLYQEVSRDLHPWAVVGGLSSAEATGLAAYSRSIQIPFLTTVCGNDGLASLSPWAIQGRTDYGGVGTELGRFAALNMGLRKLAILYVNNVEGRRMAREFRQGAEENGAAIIGEVGFYAGTIGYANYLLQLKSAVLRHSFDDSLNAEYKANGRLLLNEMVYIPTGKDIETKEIPGINSENSLTQSGLSAAYLDSLWSSVRRTYRWTGASFFDGDSAAIELPTLEGIFVVIEPGSIEMIAPQLARYRLNRQIFGDENWDNRDVLYKVQRYVNGLVFSNPLAPVNDSAMASMTLTATTQGDKSTTKYHFAGERAARILIEAAKRTNTSENYRDAIATLNGVSTLSGKVTLVKEERVDRSPKLILFKDGAFISVGE